MDPIVQQNHLKYYLVYFKFEMYLVKYINYQIEFNKLDVIVFNIFVDVLNLHLLHDFQMAVKTKAKGFLILFWKFRYNHKTLLSKL